MEPYCKVVPKNVRVDGSPFTSNGVTSSFAELNYGSVGFPCVAFHALLAARVEECSTFREAMHASANQIAFHASLTAHALDNQIPYMLTSRKRQAQKKKKMATKLRRWSYLYPKVVCLTFFCLDFLKVTEKWTLYNVKSPLL